MNCRSRIWKILQFSIQDLKDFTILNLGPERRIVERCQILIWRPLYLSGFSSQPMKANVVVYSYIILYTIKVFIIAIKINSTSVAWRFNLVKYEGPGWRIKNILGHELTINLSDTKLAIHLSDSELTIHLLSPWSTTKPFFEPWIDNFPKIK